MKISIRANMTLVRAVLVWAFVCGAAMPLSAQQEQITFPSRVMTIEDAFVVIQKQTRYLISVASGESFNAEAQVGLSSQKLPLSKALTELLVGSQKEFRFQGRHILIYKPVPKPPEHVVYDTVRHEPINVDSLAYVLRTKKRTDYATDYPDEPVLNTAYLQKVHKPAPPLQTKFPRVALRTNLLYDIAALTPNLGIEVGIARRSTLLLTGSYNPWNSDGKKDNNKKLNHWLVGLEYRYWLCERFHGHFLGVHAFGGHYNISGYNIPLVLEKDADQYRYRGDVIGGGIDYGYHWMWSKHWSMEFNIGVGVGFMKYDKYNGDNCGQCREENQKRTFIAPTKAGISLIYLIK
ncbi:MAG: DUF3575 domain-containing protein [Mediterranea sp.]|nr:DUF3575 domain-containing protein [Mediterranea sp.]